MDNQWWSWLLTLVGVACFWLAGKKVWWAWYIGLAGQITWLAYSLITQQWGFLLGVVLYSVVYTRNSVKWTRERFDKNPAPAYLIEGDYLVRTDGTRDRLSDGTVALVSADSKAEIQEPEVTWGDNSVMLRDENGKEFRYGAPPE